MVLAAMVFWFAGIVVALAGGFLCFQYLKRREYVPAVFAGVACYLGAATVLGVLPHAFSFV